MSKSSAPAEPKVMPTLPAASIDFNALLEADARGATGDALVDASHILMPRTPDAPVMPGEMLKADQPEVAPAAPAKPAPADKA